jgi:hypothetical protein
MWAFLRLAWGRRRPHPEADELISLWMSDVRTWVAGGIAKPGPCTLSYPRSLLEQAYEGAPGLRDLLSDVDCGDSLLSDDASPLPNHLCHDTIFATTRKYAPREYPPRNAAQRIWVRAWPFPVGARSMQSFARRWQIDVKDLPPAPEKDDPGARVGLWVERRAAGNQRGISVEKATLLGRASWSGWRQRGSRRNPTFELGRAITYTRHSSHAGQSSQEVQIKDGVPTYGPLQSMGHEDEWRLQDLSRRNERDLILWYERVAMGVPNERRRGRKPGPTPELESALALLPEVYAEVSQLKNSNEVPVADLIRAFQLAGLDVPPSTVYGWHSSGKLPVGPVHDDSE